MAELRHIWLLTGLFQFNCLCGMLSDKQQTETLLMPKGPKGEKRPGDVVGAAVMVARIATGEIEEKTEDGKNAAAVALGRKGGKARAEKLTPQERQDIAKKAAKARWQK